MSGFADVVRCRRPSCGRATCKRLRRRAAGAAAARSSQRAAHRGALETAEAAARRSRWTATRSSRCWSTSLQERHRGDRRGRADRRSRCAPRAARPTLAVARQRARACRQEARRAPVHAVLQHQARRPRARSHAGAGDPRPAPLRVRLGKRAGRRRRVPDAMRMTLRSRLLHSRLSPSPCGAARFAPGTNRRCGSRNSPSCARTWRRTTPTSTGRLTIGRSI